MSVSVCPTPMALATPSYPCPFSVSFPTNPWPGILPLRPTTGRRTRSRNNRDGMGAFAVCPCTTLSKLTRSCVAVFVGSNGALLCDFHHSGPNGETGLYYDQPAYDEFWNV